MIKANVDALRQLIANRIATTPYELDGFSWCAMPQPQMAAELGISVETLRRLVCKPPFVRQRVQGCTLVREGAPGPKTARHIANEMSKVWRAFLAKQSAAWAKEKEELLSALEEMEPDEKIEAADKIKRRTENFESRSLRTSRQEYGCMCGLAEAWPQGMQVEIFKTVIGNWPQFMAGAKLAQAAAEMEGENVHFRFYKFPVISFIRRWPNVATEMMEQHYQETGELPPAHLRQLQPELWHVKGLKHST